MYPYKSIAMLICAAVAVALFIASIVILVKFRNFNDFTDDLNAAEKGQPKPEYKGT